MSQRNRMAHRGVPKTRADAERGDFSQFVSLSLHPIRLSLCVAHRVERHFVDAARLPCGVCEILHSFRVFASRAARRCGLLPRKTSYAWPGLARCRLSRGCVWCRSVVDRGDERISRRPASCAPPKTAYRVLGKNREFAPRRVTQNSFQTRLAFLMSDADPHRPPEVRHLPKWERASVMEGWLGVMLQYSDKVKHLQPTLAKLSCAAGATFFALTPPQTPSDPLTVAPPTTRVEIRRRE